jgi:hypothetical protein
MAKQAEFFGIEYKEGLYETLPRRSSLDNSNE